MYSAQSSTLFIKNQEYINGSGFMPAGIVSDAKNCLHVSTCSMLLTRSPTHSHTHTLTHTLTHSLTHSHSFIHALTHSLTRFFFFSRFFISLAGRVDNLLGGVWRLVYAGITAPALRALRRVLVHLLDVLREPRLLRRAGSSSSPVHVSLVHSLDRFEAAQNF